MKLKKVIQLSNWFDAKENLIEIINNGKIFVNSISITDPDYEVNYQDVINYKEKSFIFVKEINLVMHKPCGYVSATKDDKHPTVTSLLTKKYQSYKWSIAGRLDKDVSGVLILTTSGKINQRIANPIFNVYKTYLATTTNEITTSQINALNNYLLLQDQDGSPYLSKFKSVRVVDKYNVEVVLSEGKYHQVKNSFIAIKNPLEKLKRIKVGNLDLKNLKEGETYEFNFTDFVND